MEYLLKSSEMKNCDKVTSEYFKIPSICLMERAAVAAFEEINKLICKKDSVLIVAGSGNNGGDAMAVGRLLFLEGFNVTAAFIGNPENLSEQAGLQLDILKQYKVPLIVNEEDIHNIDFDSYSCIIEGIFGVGLNREITGRYCGVIDRINETKNSKIFAVDIPSGINADNGKVMGRAVRADYTITFAFKKAGQYLYPGSGYCGKIILKDIGITTHSLLENKPQLYTYSREDLITKIPARENNSNKGTFGKVTLFVGSVNMAGAAFLSAKAALCTGCGYVRIVTPKENRIILQTLLPEAVLTTYDADDFSNDDFTDIIKSSSAVVCGCGLGTEKYAVKLLETVLKNCNKNLILDGDALNILSENKYLYKYTGANTIITPHLGEMSRLTDIPIKEIKENLEDAARKFADEHSLCCVLKDARTLVSMPGFSDYLNIYGCNGMSTAGSGDVLAGIISGLLAVGMEIKDAADCGVLLHSLAGEAASAKYGNASMTAGNIAEEISSVLRSLL